MLQLFTSTFWQTLSQDLTENPYTTYAQEIKNLSYGQELSDLAVEELMANFKYQLLFNSEFEFRSDVARIRLYLKKFPYQESLNYSRVESKSLLEDSFYRYNQLISTEFEALNSAPVAEAPETPATLTAPTPNPAVSQTSTPVQPLTINLESESFNNPVQQNPEQAEIEAEPDSNQVNQQELQTQKMTLNGSDKNLQDSEDELGIEYRNESNFKIPVDTRLNQTPSSNFSIQDAKAALQASEQERQRRLQFNQVMNQQQSQQQLSNYERTLQATRQNSATTRSKNSTTSKLLKGLAVTGTVGTGAAVSGLTLFNTLFF
jgi:hypothetical protein